MRPSSTKHIFALFWNNQSSLASVFQKSSLITVDNQELQHRIQNILRLEQGDELIIFDQKDHVNAQIADMTKKSITLKIQKYESNIQHNRSMISVLPLLKREALESAVDALTQLGATTIQLITTQKSQRSWSGQKEFDRLQRIIWAAAEQSKNFAFPELLSPLSLQEFLTSLKIKETLSVFFDPQGVALSDILKIETNKNSSLTLIVGPEGDLTEQEKQLLKDYDVLFSKLTPTVLRAELAAAIGLGIFRSLFI